MKKDKKLNLIQKIIVNTMLIGIEISVVLLFVWFISFLCGLIW